MHLFVDLQAVSREVRKSLYSSNLPVKFAGLLPLDHKREPAKTVLTNRTIYTVWIAFWPKIQLVTQ